MNLTASCLLALLLASTGPVLGPEAEGVLAPWAKGLHRLRVEAIKIQKDAIEISLEPPCVMRIVHPQQGGCDDGVLWGNALVCWEGDRCPPASRRAGALARAGELKLPWKAAPGDGMSGRDAADAARRALIEGRQRAQERLDVRDREGAQEQLIQLLDLPDIRPEDLLSVLPALGALGEGGRALGVTGEEPWMRLDPGLLSLVRLVLLAGPDQAALAAPVTLNARTACQASAIGSAFVMVGRFRSAAVIGEAIRALDASCWDAYGLEAEARARLRDGPGLARLLARARGHFPAGDERIRDLEEMTWLAQGQTDQVVARLEERIASGDRSPGVFKDVLALYVRQELRSQKITTWVERSKAAPDDPVAAFFAGVLLHYEKQFKRSQALLEVAERELASEPRLYIYRAMNAFNLGDRSLAEGAIEQAGRLEVQDPDVHYCRGEIYRDTEPRKALEALETYWHQTSATSDPNSSKQRRVLGLIAAVKKCLSRREPGPCPGPWEHTFGAAREP